jgi:hypothetical protein
MPIDGTLGGRWLDERRSAAERPKPGARAGHIASNSTCSRRAAPCHRASGSAAVKSEMPSSNDKCAELDKRIEHYETVYRMPSLQTQ